MDHSSTELGPRSDQAPCSARGGDAPLISKWGGARANSGGARPGSGRKPTPPAPVRAIEYRTGPRWYVIGIGGRDPQATMRDLSRGEDRETRIYAPDTDRNQVALRTHHFCRPAYETYLPLLPVIRRARNGVRTIDHAPMLLGYALIRFDVRVDDWRPLVSCPGVRELMATRSGLPSPVRDSEVDWLRRVSEEQLGIDPEAMTRRAPGSTVTPTDGPFAKIPAVVVSCDGYHTVATVNVFGRDVPLMLPWAGFT